MAAILAGATTVCAQQAPAQQAPANTPAQTPDQTQSASGQSSSQEATAEDIGTRRKVKPKDYKNWTFNVGGGGSLTNGTTTKFARSGAVAAAGVARNYSKYFGLRVDFQWDNLPLRNSALALAQAPGATSQVYSFTFDPIINIPVNKTWGGYFVFGPSYYHRSGKLDSSSVVAGTALQRVLELVGNLLQRQRSDQSTISFRQRERIRSEFWRRHHAPDHLQVRALRRVPLSARVG